MTGKVDREQPAARQRGEQGSQLGGAERRAVEQTTGEPLPCDSSRARTLSSSQQVPGPAATGVCFPGPSL
jgi:hypothetical protein